MYMYVCISRRPYVCRLSVCLSVCRSVCLSIVCNVCALHPTQAIEIFGNVSTPFGILTVPGLSIKILRRSSPGTPPSGVKRKRGSQNIAILDLSKAISRKQCKIGNKLLLITNRKSYMSSRLVLKSVTLNDLKRRNGRYIALFQRIW